MLASAASAASAFAEELPPRPELPAFADRMDAAVAAVATAKRGEAGAVARRHGLELDQQLVELAIFTRASAEASGLAARRVQALGGSVGTAVPGVLEAAVPPRALAELGEEQTIKRLATPLEPDPFAVTGQGVAVTNASAMHAQGITGAGVKVAVIDVGFFGYTASQASGDLPAGVVTQNYCDGGFTNSGHGTGVAEIVHDMAPGAQLSLVCVDNSADLAAAGTWAASQGVRVVNHSAGYYNTSRGDGSGAPGSPDATVAQARANGILWANSTGNQAERHWGGQFVGGGGLPDLHDWAPGDEGNRVAIAGGQQACFALKWDSWPVTNQDYDLLLYDADGLYASGSSSVQDGNDPPTEGFCYTNSGPSAVFDLEIYRFSAPASPRLDLFWRGGGPGLEHRVAATSVTEPSSAPAATGVGAVCVFTDTLANYSSRGPTVDGRLKPDLSAPTAVSDSGGTATNCNSGFTGTSASSPHVAGAAALLMQGSSAGPAAIEAQLESSARDLGLAGPDNAYGWGEIYFPGSALPPPPPPPPSGPAQPDLRFGASGDDLHALDPYSQVQRLKLRRGREKTLALALENDGGRADQFTLYGDRRLSRVSARYFVAGEDVTGAVTSGSYRRALGAGEAVEVTVAVRAKRNARRGWRDLFLGTENAIDPGLADAAAVSVKAR